MLEDANLIWQRAKIIYAVALSIKAETQQEMKRINKKMDSCLGEQQNGVLTEHLTQ